LKRHLKCLNSSLADYDFDHDEIVEKLVALGAGLGFEAESEVLIASGARVDVVWKPRCSKLRLRGS